MRDLKGLAHYFKNNGFIYVNYIASGVNRTIVSQFNLLPGNPNVVDSLSEKIILTIGQPFANHNGGCLSFGKDGYLYIGMGDGGSANDPLGNGQNKQTMLAKMLRIDIDTTASYKIPTSNPFVKDSNYLPEIWATGLRNPWRWSFDRLNGDMWIGDVGQGNWEEVDYQKGTSKGGENYGWKCYEGKADFSTAGCGIKSTYTFPVQDYFSDENKLGCSVTGGYVFRESPCSYLYGDYIYGDYCSGIIWAIRKVTEDSFVNRKIYTHSRNQISSFGEDSSGTMYLCALGEGSVYKISDTCSISVNVASINPSCLGKKDGSISLSSINSTCILKYNWNNSSTSDVITNLGSGIYTVTITNSTCQKVINFSLKNIVEDSICLTPLFVDKICADDSAIIIACDNNQNAKYQWYKEGVVDSFLMGKRIFVRQSGNYQVKIILPTGCESKLSNAANILVFPLPVKPLLTLIKDSLIATANYNSYAWFFNGQLVSGSIANYLKIKNDGFYQVEVIDSNLCRSLRSDSLYYSSTNVMDMVNSTVKVVPNPSMGVFNFYFESMLIEPSQLSIFNADSKLVYQENIESGVLKRSVDLRNSAPGIYFYILSNPKNYTTVAQGRLIKY